MCFNVWTFVYADPQNWVVHDLIPYYWTLFMNKPNDIEKKEKKIRNGK